MAVASTAFAVFLFFRLRYVFAVNDPVMVWNTWITKGWMFFRAYQYAPFCMGIVLGVLQFLPEVQAHRVRLVLHLPLNEERAVGIHLLAGTALLVLALIPAVLIFVIGGAIYFPGEWQGNLLNVLAPWLLAGFGAYFGAAALLLENNWRHRVVYLLLFAGGLRLYWFEEFYDGYARILPPLALWVACLALVPLFSTFRFRKGLAK